MSAVEESWQSIADTLGFTDENEMLRHLYQEQGFSLNEIAKVVGYSTWTVRARLLRLGVELRGRGGADIPRVKRKLSDLTDDELFHVSIQTLVKQHGVHPSTISSERRYRNKMKNIDMEEVV